MKKNIPQLATVKIKCNNEVGTALIYFPDPEVEYVYVFTAKHCLTGKNFDKDFVNTGIVLDEIFNEETSILHSYNLIETDIVRVSGDDEDLALLILSKNDIMSLTGKQFFCQVMDTDTAIENYQIRGFANFNDQDKDRYFSLKFYEDEKGGPSQFSLRSEESLDTYYEHAIANVAGLSGSGAYSIIHGNIYLTGIIHDYEEKGIFLATKVLAYNKLIPPDKFLHIICTKPETDKEVISSYSEMENNENATTAKTNEKIGDFHVPRDNTKLIQLIKDKSLVIVNGKPGVGKSALTKSAVSVLKVSGNHTILTLTAENLYCETLNEALQNSGYTVDIKQLLESPLSNEYFLIWIESFEKLLESAKSEAFKELLRLLENNRKITIVLTIRDYLLQNFRVNYYSELPNETAYLQVDEFNDEEIEIIRQEIPELSYLLDNSKINHLLRTPYYLDKAVRIIPELLLEETLDEMQFKRLMWKHIVEDNSTKRGIVFSNICLKRSIEMTLFTTYTGDEEITFGLVRDNILQLDSQADVDSFSPSHDILEDWALIRYIRQQKLEVTGVKEFLFSLENTPSMKRAFRLWMEELYVNDPEESVSFVHEILNDTIIPQDWKNEILIVSLRSAHSDVILDSLKDQLLDDSASLLEKIISLLQTGSKKMDPIKRDFYHLLPVGSGWDFIIDFIRHNLLEISKISGFEIKYLSLIEAWSKQLNKFNQGSLPSGAESAAILLEDLVYRSQTISSRGNLNHGASPFLKKFIENLFKLTEAAPVLVGKLVYATLNPQEEDSRWNNQATLREIRNYIIDGVISDQICRFFPDEVLEMAKDKWVRKEEKHTAESFSGMFVEEPEQNDFGLHKDLDYDYEFPSAYGTFFYWMFLYHPVKALDFIISFLNEAFEYNHKILAETREGLEKINIQFEDCTERHYYGNCNYWSMYKGFNSDNRVLTSLLMALEKSLLDLGERADFQSVQNYLKRLIQESNNVAVLGIVSSVLQAYPSILDEYTVSLLGIPNFFEWDSSRSTSEMVGTGFYPQDEFERLERLTENQRVHRRKYYVGLVGFVAHYMFFERKLNDLLFKQIDQMWEKLSEDNIGFKKFLFDMDARKYALKPHEDDAQNNFVQLGPGYDEEVSQMVNSYDADDYPKVNAMWARNAYENTTMTNHNYETWKNGYEYILKLKGKRHIMVSPVTMAVVALRDFSSDLLQEELSWCFETVLSLGVNKLKDKDSYTMDLDSIDSGPGLRGLSYVFKSDLDAALQLKAKELIFRLLLKGLDERDRFSLQAGIYHDLSCYQPEFVKNCWYGLIEFIRIKKGLNEEYKKRKNLYNREEISADELNQANNDWFEELVMSVISGGITAPETIDISLDMSTHWYLDDAIRIIPWKTDLQVHHKFIQDFLELHLGYLNNSKLHSYSDYHDSRNTLTFFYARYLLSQPIELSMPLFKNLLDLILERGGNTDTKKFVNYNYRLVKEFIFAAAENLEIEKFWIFWMILKEWSIENLNGTYFPLLLFDIEWKESLDKWSVLEGKHLLYKDFITNWGFNRLDSSIRFLTGVAFYNFMPYSISWIALMLKSTNKEEENILLLDKFIEKAFYKYGATIKRKKNILRDFLNILDFLIEKSSPKAYMLRDELLQYK